MKYTQINKNNYGEACDYWTWLLRYGTTKEQEKEREDLAILLNNYEVDNLYGNNN